MVTPATKQSTTHLVHQDEHEAGPEGGPELCDNAAAEQLPRVPAQTCYAHLHVGEERPAGDPGQDGEGGRAERGGGGEGRGHNEAGQEKSEAGKQHHQPRLVARQEKCEEGHQWVCHGM